MGGEHLGRRHRGAALQRHVLLRIRRHPAGGRTVDRLLHVVARRQRDRTAGEDREHPVGLQDVAGLLDPLDAHDIGAGRQARIVGQADLRQDQTENRGDMSAHVGDSRVEPGGRVEHHGHEVGRELDMDVVEIEHVAHPVPRGILGFRRLFHLCRRGGALRLLAVTPPGRPAEAERAEHERHEGQPGHQREQPEQDRDGPERRRVAAELREQRHVGRPGRPAAREQEGGGDRDDDRGDLAHQPVADREDRVSLEGAADIHAVDGDPHDQTHDDVEHRDQQAGDGIALDEFRGAVERAEKGRLLLLAFAPRLGLFVGDRARGDIGVDGELLARHAVEREPGADLGHPPRALGDDDEIDDQQHQEDDEAEKHAPRHHEARKPLDHMPRRGGAGVTVADDELGRGDVERQPQHQAREQHGRKDREIQRAFDEQRHREHQDRQRKGEREPGVEHPGRHRQDHHHDDRHQRQRQQDRRSEKLCECRCHAAPYPAPPRPNNPTPPPFPVGNSEPSAGWPPPCNSG